MGYKSVDGLMRHLRTNGIKIAGSKQKRQLRNTGYFHGYKGYRFFGLSDHRIPFTTYDEIYATIRYDSKLKSLFYEKIMFIETAAKNIALECIMKKAGSESIQDMYKNVVCGYHNAPAGSNLKIKKTLQEKKLRLEGMIQSYLSRAYKDGNPKITHFYNNMSYSGVPLWALFEIMTMGDFGYLLSCLTFDTRDSISIEMCLSDAAVDTNRDLIYKYIYTLKDLRNAVAHNSVVFDTRFRRIDPTPAMKKCLMQEFGLPYVNFKTIGDYLILICYYLKIFGVPKTEIKAFIRNFENITDEYRGTVNTVVATKVLHPDLPSRLSILKSRI
mgnify:CR=1 FL=1